MPQTFSRRKSPQRSQVFPSMVMAAQRFSGLFMRVMMVVTEPEIETVPSLTRAAKGFGVGEELGAVGVEGTLDGEVLQDSADQFVADLLDGQNRAAPVSPERTYRHRRTDIQTGRQIHTHTQGETQGLT